MAGGGLKVELDSLIPSVPTVADRGAAADLATEAFFDNPGHTFIYPDLPTRQDESRWLMYVNLGGQLATG